MKTLENYSPKTKEQFIKDVISNCKSEQWIIFQGLVTENNQTFEVELKMFNKWLQIFRINRIGYQNSMYCTTQRELKEHVNKSFENVIKNQEILVESKV